MKKFLLLFCLTSFALAVVMWWQWPDQHVHVVMCDVGQGDGFLISSGYQQFLIDTGPDDAIGECLAQYVPFWDRRIETVMITHADKDHIGGLPTVLTSYQVDTLLWNETEKTTKIVQTVRDLVDEQQVTVKSVFQGDEISFASTKEDVVFRAIWPPIDQAKQRGKLNDKPEANDSQTELGYTRVLGAYTENNRSISGKLTIGEVDFLFLGDIDSSIELAIAAHTSLTGIEVIKVAHHGSKSSSDATFIQKVKPEIGLFSLKKSNSYGHPHTRVIDLFRSSNIEILRTDELGDVHLVTDGKRIWQATEW